MPANTEKWYRVEVVDHAGQIVSIEPRELTGREIGEQERETIRRCAHQLLGFIGETPASMPMDPPQHGLTDAEMKEQATRCGCRGSDDLCGCQNQADTITLRKWRYTTAANMRPSDLPANTGEVINFLKTNVDLPPSDNG